MFCSSYIAKGDNPQCFSVHIHWIEKHSELSPLASKDDVKPIQLKIIIFSFFVKSWEFPSLLFVHHDFWFDDYNEIDNSLKQKEAVKEN